MDREERHAIPTRGKYGPGSTYPDRETVERLRQQYPRGTRVELVSLNDPYTSLRPGDKGTVLMVDDIGTVFVRWDNGSGLGVVYGEDRIRKL